MTRRRSAEARADQPSGSRLSHRDGILTVVVILTLVNLLFTIDAAARGFGPKVPDIPAEIVMHALFCLQGYLLFLVIRGVDHAPLAARLIVIFIFCVILGSLFTPIVHGVQYILAPHNGITPRPISLRRIQAGTIPYLFTAAGLLAVDFNRKVREREQQLERSQALSREARLLALRYQIDPHFLFNTLNSISALVLMRRNGAAEDMLLRLSDFFRLTLELGSERITLAQELELQRAYLAVEQARFGDALRLDIDVPGELMDARVPALLLQPLVENAVKHGARSGVIAIEARPEEAGLVLTVTNPIATAGPAGPAGPAGATVGTGTGIRNVRDRLNSAYGAGAALAIDPNEAGVFQARLTLPRAALDPAGPAPIEARRAAPTLSS